MRRMRRSVVLRVLPPVACALVLTVPPMASPAPAQTGAPKDADAQQIRAAEADLRDALLAADAGRLERLLADDWTVIHTSGFEQMKSQYIDALRAGRFRFKAMDVDQLTVRTYGDAAVVTARSTNAIEFRGESSSGRVRYTRVWVRTGERWRAVSEQATHLD